MKLLCKGGWVGRVKATLLSLAIEFSLVVGATVGISFLLRVAQLNESEFELTMRLAEGGDTTAQWNLGVMYDTGVGVPQDYKEAVKWYTKAAEQGDVDAQWNLGSSNDTDAQNNLGRAGRCMFDNGEGVVQDYKEAFQWFTKAAEQGEMSTLSTTLGICTAKEKECLKIIRRQSSGTPRRPSREMSTLSATLGLCTTTEKVPKDLVQAYAWYDVANANGQGQGLEGQKN